MNIVPFIALMTRKPLFSRPLWAGLFIGVVGLVSMTGTIQPVRAEAAAAPDFVLKDLSGKDVRLSALKFKVAVIDFWATWCPPCRAEMPHFAALYRTYHGKGLEIVGISLDESVEPVKKFVAEFKTPYPIVMGTQKVVSAYGGVKGIPTTFVIDGKRRIVKKYVGYRPPEVFEKDIQDLLKSK